LREEIAYIVIDVIKVRRALVHHHSGLEERSHTGRGQWGLQHSIWFTAAERSKCFRVHPLPHFLPLLKAYIFKYTAETKSFLSKI